MRACADSGEPNRTAAAHGFCRQAAPAFGVAAVDPAARQCSRRRFRRARGDPPSEERDRDVQLAAEDDRRRRLIALSRFNETPRQLVIELNADGTDYVSHGSFQEEEFTGSWQTLRAVREDAPRKLTRAQVGKRWPADAEAPPGLTLWRWLERATAAGLVRREGTGRKRDPYRYWLPGKEEEWKQPAWQRELDALAERLSQGPDAPAGGPPLLPPEAGDIVVILR